MSPTEVAFLNQKSDEIKTQIVLNYLIEMGRQIDGDYVITGRLDTGGYVHVKVMVTNSKIPPEKVDKK